MIPDSRVTVQFEGTGMPENTFDISDTSNGRALAKVAFHWTTSVKYSKLNMTIDGSKLLEDESLRAFMRMFNYSPEKTLVIEVDWSVYVKFQGPGMPRHVFKFQPTRDGNYVAKVVARQSRNTVTTEQLRLTAGDESLLPTESLCEFMKKIGHPLGDTLEISVVASEVQSEPMEVEDASGQSDDMAKDTQMQGGEQTFVGSDGKDYVARKLLQLTALARWI